MDILWRCFFGSNLWRMIISWSHYFIYSFVGFLFTVSHSLQFLQILSWRNKKQTASNKSVQNSGSLRLLGLYKQFSKELVALFRPCFKNIEMLQVLKIYVTAYVQILKLIPFQWLHIQTQHTPIKVYRGFRMGCEELIYFNECFGFITKEELEETIWFVTHVASATQSDSFFCPQRNFLNCANTVSLWSRCIYVFCFQSGNI